MPVFKNFILVVSLAVSGSFVGGLVKGTALAYADVSNTKLNKTTTISDFVKVVQEKNSSYTAAIKKIKALNNKSFDSSLMFVPELYSSVEWTQDRGPRLNIAFQGDQSQTTEFNLGVRQKTRFGLDASLSFRSFRERFQGRPTEFFPLNLEQSLLRNSFGKQNRLIEEQNIAVNYAEALAEEKKAIDVLVSAQKAYWNYAVNKKILSTLEQSAERAKAILDYNKKGSGRGVVDVGEVLQAKAGYLQRKLEVEESKDSLTIFEKDYRSFVEDQDVSLSIEEPSTEVVLSLKVPDLSKKSLSIVTQEQNIKALKYKNEAYIDGAKPELKVFGNLTTGAIQEGFSDATGDAFSTDLPVTTVGLNLSIPLAFGKVNKILKGYREEVVSSEISLKHLIIDDKVLKDKQLTSFRDLKSRLSFVTELEIAQKKKLEHEKRLQKNGRSTTYQVLLFEQDYLAAQVANLRLRSEIMNLYVDFHNFSRLKDFL
jgi:outer membrane protein TolC